MSAAWSSRLGRIGAWFHPGYGDEVEATLLALDQQVPHAQRGSSLQRGFSHGRYLVGVPVALLNDSHFVRERRP